MALRAVAEAAPTHKSQQPCLCDSCVAIQAAKAEGGLSDPAATSNLPSHLATGARK